MLRHSAPAVRSSASLLHLIVVIYCPLVVGASFCSAESWKEIAGLLMSSHSSHVPLNLQHSNISPRRSSLCCSVCVFTHQSVYCRPLLVVTHSFCRPLFSVTHHLYHDLCLLVSVTSRVYHGPSHDCTRSGIL